MFVVFLSVETTGLRRAVGFAAVIETVEADIGITKHLFKIKLGLRDQNPNPLGKNTEYGEEEKEERGCSTSISWRETVRSEEGTR